MSKQTKFDARLAPFIIKTAACFFGLLLGFFILSPTAFMQQSMSAPPPPPPPPAVMSNGNYTMGNYQPTPEPPRSTLRGRVLYADTGQAVRRAGLMLLPAQRGSGGGRENAGVTNERGEFEIKGVAEGRYFMSVSTPGVLTPTSSVNGLEGIEPGGQNEAAVADIAKDFQEIAVNGVNDADVVITVKRGAAITGKIMYSDGTAATGVRVEILRKKGGQYNAVITSLNEIFGTIFGGAAGGMRTDDRGVYRIAGLPAGEYVVRAVENVSHSEKSIGRGDGEMMAMLGFNPSSMVATYYPSAGNARKAETVKVELGQEQSEINITIPDRALRDANGVVVNKATRQPIKGARVSIKGEDNVNSIFGVMGETGGAKNETDEQGRWNFKELPAGRYTLTVEPPYDYQRSENKGAQKAKQPKLSITRREIVVEDKDLTDLTVELGYGATISGTIVFDTQQPFAQSIVVAASDENGKFSESDYVGAPSYQDDGGKPQPKKSQDFKIEGIPAGKVFVGATAGGGDESAQRFYVKSILYGGRDIARSTLETREGEEIKGVQIVLSRDVGTLKGSVVKADKTPAAGARFSLVPTDKTLWDNAYSNIYAQTNSDGAFEVHGAPGDYFVVFYKAENYDGDEKDADKSFRERARELLERETADAPKVTIKAKEIEKITLTLP